MTSVVTFMLLWMVTLFGLIVIAYYLLRIDKKNKKLYADFIHGSWQRRGKSETGEDWEITYTFNDGQFFIDAQPKYTLKGRYKILKEVEQLLVLELAQVQGNQEDIENYLPPQYLSLGVDVKDKKLMIDGKGYWKLT